jgi:hypothetical protein
MGPHIQAYLCVTPFKDLWSTQRKDSSTDREETSTGEGLLVQRKVHPMAEVASSRNSTVMCHANLDFLLDSVDTGLVSLEKLGYVLWMF